MSVSSLSPSTEAPAPHATHARWLAVSAAALAMVATMPGRTHGLGLITAPLMKDLGLDAVTYGTINFLATLLGAGFCFPVGWLLDRLAHRHVLAAVTLLLGAVVVLMTRTEYVWAVALLILLTRGLGQSALSVVSLAVVGRASAGRSRLAIAIYSVLVGLGFMAAYVAVTSALKAEGWTWRDVWAGIGWTLILGAAPLGWLLAGGGGATKADGPVDDDGFTLREALRTPAFWAFGLAMSLYGLAAAGISLFQELLLQERGFNRDVFFSVVSAGPLIGLVFNFLGGWLGPRWSIQRLLGVTMAMMAAAALAFPNIDTIPQLVAYVLAMAFAGGVVTVLFFSVWSRFYGQTQLGRIQGAAQAMTVFASALGQLLPPLANYWSGSFRPFFYILAVVSGLLGLWVWFVPTPRRASTHKATP